jgi:hypothetical protein
MCLHGYSAGTGREGVGESKEDLGQINVPSCAHVRGRDGKALVITVDEIHDHIRCSLTLIQSQVLNEDHHNRVLIRREI